MFFSYFLLPQLSFFFFFVLHLTQEHLPLGIFLFLMHFMWNYWILQVLLSHIIRSSSSLLILHMQHLSCDLPLLVEFVKYLLTSSRKRTLQNRAMILLKIPAWIYVSTRIVSRKVSFSVQTKKSQNLKPVTNNCVWIW